MHVMHSICSKKVLPIKHLDIHEIPIRCRQRCCLSILKWTVNLAIEILGKGSCEYGNFLYFSLNNESFTFTFHSTYPFTVPYLSNMNWTKFGNFLSFMSTCIKFNRQESLLVRKRKYHSLLKHISNERDNF